MQPTDLVAETVLGRAQHAAVVARRVEDRQLGGLLGQLELGHRGLQRVEGVPQVDPSLSLQRVVQVAHVARFGGGASDHGGG